MPAPYDPGRYGSVVGDYDTLYPADEALTDAAADLLAELALERPERSLLELGIGTGRLALRVQERGAQVGGIDGSRGMIEQLKAKPGGVAIPVVEGDYRDARIAGRYAVVLLAFNGIFDPRGRDAQLDIFRNARRHLGAGGCFVVESWVMSDQHRNGDWSVVPRFVGDEHVEFQLARFDLDRNAIERTLVHLRPEGLDFVSVVDTYASPGELDVMAHVTGFQRVARYGGWDRTPFTVASTSHVSVYQLTAGA